MNIVTITKHAPGEYSLAIGSDKTGTKTVIKLPAQTLERLGQEIQKALKGRRT